MKFFLCSLFTAFFFCQSVSAQLALNELSQGNSGNREYIELVVMGTRTCSDSCADLRGWIFDDQNGWYGSGAVSGGCYRFPNVPNWSCVPYGSIIVIYNSGDKNTSITQADDEIDANHDGVYILPITSSYLELNSSFPLNGGGSGSSFSYPTTGYGTSTSWVPITFNNGGDAFLTVSPTALNTAYHSFSYGNISGTMVHVAASGGQTVYYATGNQYNANAGWTSGSVPSNETPGAPNTTANATWINGMKVITGGGGIPHNVNDTACQGIPYVFGSKTLTASGVYTDTFHTVGCDSIVILNLFVAPIPAAPTVTTPISYCQNEVATALTATGVNILWYTSFTGTGNAIPPIPSTTVPGTATYWATQKILGCESPKTQIDINTIATPAAPIVASPIIYCKNAVVPPLTAQGLALLWYNVPNGSTGSSVAPVPNTAVAGTTTWYVSQTVAGCESPRTAMQVTVQEVTALFTIGRDTICQEDSIQFINASTGKALTYAWDFADGNSSFSKSPFHQFLLSGDFAVQLVATDDRLCADTAIHNIHISPLPTFDFKLADSVICQGEAAIINSSISPGYLFANWDFGDGNTRSIEQGLQHAYDIPGEFTISVKALYAVCPEQNMQRTVTVESFPVADLGADSSICPGNTIRISNSLYNSSVRYHWSTGDTTASIAVTSPGIYWVEARNGSCRVTDSTEILKSCYVNIPNAFTPDQDGINDYFFPRELLSLGLAKFHMQLFNRWGQLIFETQTLDGRGWDGQFNGVPQPSGVYLYLIDATFLNGTTEKQQGNVTLMR